MDAQQDTAAAAAESASRSRGNWTKEEDQMLRDLVGQYGLKKWAVIATKLPSGRIGKQCRERWVNHLDVYVKKAPWTNEEDNILIQGQKRLGNKWCAISKLLVGRPENAVKNRWNSIVNRLKHQLMREEEMATLGGEKQEEGDDNEETSGMEQVNGGTPLPPPPPPPPPPQLLPRPITPSSTAAAVVLTPANVSTLISPRSEAEEELLCAFTSLQRTKMDAVAPPAAPAPAPAHLLNRISPLTPFLIGEAEQHQQQRLEMEALEGICALKRMPTNA